jgi:hypothetical protein
LGPSHRSRQAQPRAYKRRGTLPPCVGGELSSSKWRTPADLDRPYKVASSIGRSTMTSRLARLTILALGCLWFASAMALACPPGSRFSAKADGTNGICAILGQGATPMVRCFVADGACPGGHSREHSNNDPTRDYCCPTGRAQQPKCVARGVAPFCEGKCLPGEKNEGFFIPSKGPTCKTGSMLWCCRR